MSCNEFKVGQQVVTAVMGYGIPEGTPGIILEVCWTTPVEELAEGLATGRHTACYTVDFGKDLVRYGRRREDEVGLWTFFNTELRPYEEAAPAVPDGDDFNGTTALLIQCMEVLGSRLDPATAADGVLVPHGIGRSASRLLSAAANRLRQQAAPAVPIAEVLLDDGWRSNAQDSGV